MSDSPSFDLSGKTAVVTGSTRGIGKAIADAYEAAGARVVRHGSKVCDLSDIPAVEAWFASLVRDGLAPDILVANASTQFRAPWSSFPLDEARREFETNFFATLRLFQLAYPHMRQKGWGRLISVGSVQERRPHPDMAAYAASKGALENLVRNIAKQVAPDGITVNNLCPGVFNTDRNRDALSNPAYAEKVLAAIPLRAYALPQDATGAALLLASDAGRYITGATLLLDGGLSLP